MKNLVFVFLFLIAGCHQADEPVSAMEMSADSAPANALAVVQNGNEAEDPSAASRPDKMMIRTGKLAWETEEPAKTRQQILVALQKTKGYVAEDNEDRLYNRTTYQMVLRVPSNRFDELLAMVSEGVGTFIDRDIRVADVSAQYVDLSERLKTKKELESRYRQLLSKAEKVEDMLKIERAIAAERAEIESMEGRLRLLTNQVAYSTLTIELYTPEKEEPVIASAGFGTRIYESLLSGWHMLQDIIVGLTGVWPLLALIGAVYFLLRRVKRRRSEPVQKQAN